MNTASIGYFREDGSFAILATLNNKDEGIDGCDFMILVATVSAHLSALMPDCKMEALEREDAPDYVEIDE